MAFAYEALDTNGKSVTGMIDAATAEEATEQLHARSLFVTAVSAASEGKVTKTVQRKAPLLSGRPGNTRDLLMLAQQMTMMLRAGSRVVPALEAIETQLSKPGWRQIVADIRNQVEVGSPLSAAVAQYPHVFNETWRAVISSGESTGRTAEAFERLSTMTKQQQSIHIKVVGALVYPLALMLISVGVMLVMMFFVLPRFSDLYKMLGTPLPAMTQVMLTLSDWMVAHYLIVVVGLLLLVAGPILVIRQPAVRVWIDASMINLPLIGKLVKQINLARIFRVWGTASQSNVPLLESLELARETTKNIRYRALMQQVIEDVSEGNTIGSILAESPLVPRTMASAIGTGEASGQLSESLLFLAGYMEEENAQALATLTRLIEPVILVIMGLTVGAVAVSLFLPLFDLTGAA